MSDFMIHFNNISRQRQIEEDLWVEKLKSKGFKMAMPNDGWVDRDKKSLQLAYPYFCSHNLQSGDKAVIGFSFKQEEAKAITITNVRKGIFGLIHYEFEYTDEVLDG